MEFKIFKTTDYSGHEDHPPAPQARWESRVRVDERTCSSEEVFNSKFQHIRWRDEGTNHRVLPNGNIARDMGYAHTWVIEISTLEELLAITDAEGQIVLKRGEVEIYDSYRE